MATTTTGDTFERWLTRQERQIDVLSETLREHEQLPVHQNGTQQLLSDVIKRVERLEGVVLGIGGGIILAQLGILGVLLKSVLKL